MIYSMIKWSNHTIICPQFGIVQSLVDSAFLIISDRGQTPGLGFYTYDQRPIIIWGTPVYIIRYTVSQSILYIVLYIVVFFYSITGWWFQPLWKILVSWDDYSQFMESHKKIMFETIKQSHPFPTKHQ